MSVRIDARDLAAVHAWAATLGVQLPAGADALDPALLGRLALDTDALEGASTPVRLAQLQKARESTLERSGNARLTAANTAKVAFDLATELDASAELAGATTLPSRLRVVVQGLDALANDKLATRAPAEHLAPEELALLFGASRALLRALERTSDAQGAILKLRHAQQELRAALDTVERVVTARVPAEVRGLLARSAADLPSADAMDELWSGLASATRDALVSALAVRLVASDLKSSAIASMILRERAPKVFDAVVDAWVTRLPTTGALTRDLRLEALPLPLLEQLASSAARADRNDRTGRSRDPFDRSPTPRRDHVALELVARARAGEPVALEETGLARGWGMTLPIERGGDTFANEAALEILHHTATSAEMREGVLTFHFPGGDTFAFEELFPRFATYPAHFAALERVLHRHPESAALRALHAHWVAHQQGPARIAGKQARAAAVVAHIDALARPSAALRGALRAAKELPAEDAARRIAEAWSALEAPDRAGLVERLRADARWAGARGDSVGAQLDRHSAWVSRLAELPDRSWPPPADVFVPLLSLSARSEAGDRARALDLVEILAHAPHERPLGVKVLALLADTLPSVEGGAARFDRILERLTERASSGDRVAVDILRDAAEWVLPPFDAERGRTMAAALAKTKPSGHDVERAIQALSSMSTST